jgi:hypothetical protein
VWFPPPWGAAILSEGRLFFFKLSLDELTQVCFPFVVFKLLVRGRRKIEIWERGRKWSALSK